MDMRAVYILLCVLIVLRRLQTSSSQTCSNNQTNGFSVNGLGAGSQDIDNRNGVGYLIDTPQYDSACCGVVYKWEVYIDTVSTVTLYLQVWRPTAVSGVYQLVGANPFTVGPESNVLKTLTPASKISIRPGDKIGWYTTGGSNPITLPKNPAASYTVRVRTMSNPSANNLVNWSDGNTSTVTNQYSILAYTETDFKPLFISPPAGSTFTLTNSVAIGYSITTLAWSDADITDILTASMTTTSTEFAFNTTSGALTVASSLSGPTTSHILSFKVIDYCGNVGSLSINVTVINEPPILYGLPTAKNLSEDSTGGELIYTINATDTADFVSCSFVTNVTPFSVKLIPDSTSYGIYVDSNPNFNYDTQSQYTFDIICSDGYANSNTGTFYLYLLKNHPPVINNLQSVLTSF